MLLLRRRTIAESRKVRCCLLMLQHIVNIISRSEFLNQRLSSTLLLLHRIVSNTAATETEQLRVDKLWYILKYYDGFLCDGFTDFMVTRSTHAINDIKCGVEAHQTKLRHHRIRDESIRASVFDWKL